MRILAWFSALIVGAIASFHLLYPAYRTPSRNLLYGSRLFIRDYGKLIKEDILLNTTEFECEYNDGVDYKNIPGGIVFCYLKVNPFTPAINSSTFKYAFTSCIAENGAQMCSLKAYMIGYLPIQYPTIQHQSHSSINELEMTLAITRSYLPTIFDYSFCKTSLSTFSFLETFCIFNDGLVNTDMPADQLLCKLHYTARQQSEDESAPNTTAALADMFSLLRQLSQTIKYNVKVACYQASNANAVCTMDFRSAIKNEEEYSISFSELLAYTDDLPSHRFDEECSNWLSGISLTQKHQCFYQNGQQSVAKLESGLNFFTRVKFSNCTAKQFMFDALFTVILTVVVSSARKYVSRSILFEI